jgi:hypothetical protein
MADDPVTISGVTEFNLAPPGLKYVTGLITGPADYDATNGAAMDVSTYFQTVHDIQFGLVTAKADALVVPRYVNDDITDADGGAVYFTWSGTAGAVLANVDDTTNLSGYQWRFVAFGTEVTRT